jgi:hypothetical protein
LGGTRRKVMRSKSPCFVVFGLLVALSPSGCGPGLTQQYEDMEISVLAITKSYSETDPLQVRRPIEGHYFANVQLKFQCTECQKGWRKFDYADLMLIDTSGRFYKSNTTLEFNIKEDAWQTEAWIKFVAKEGALPRTLSFKGLQFDLSQLHGLSQLQQE